MAHFKKAADIKVAVVGYGGAFNMGRSHLNQMKEAGMTPTAVVEIDASRLKVAEQDFPGIETYSSLAGMLRKSGANLVTIITPHNTHAKLALQCLRAGRHVVCEKPLAVTTRECDAMIAAAKKARVVLSTYHNRHWDGCILEAVERIKGGAIGEVVRAELHMGGYRQPGDWWRTSRTISGGVLYDWGVHLLEYALQVMDSGIVEVAGFAKQGFWGPKTAWKQDAIEDEGFAVVRFKNGAWMTLCVTNIDSNPKSGMIEFTGTQGSYVMDHNVHRVIRHGADGKVVCERQNRPSENQKYYQNIADHLVKGTKLVITPEWSRRPIHILDLAVRSARQGRALRAAYA